MSLVTEVLNVKEPSHNSSTAVNAEYRSAFAVLHCQWWSHYMRFFFTFDCDSDKKNQICLPAFLCYFTIFNMMVNWYKFSLFQFVNNQQNLNALQNIKDDNYWKCKADILIFYYLICKNKNKYFPLLKWLKVDHS